MKCTLIIAALICVSATAQAQISQYTKLPEQKIVNTHVSPNWELIQAAAARQRATLDARTKACAENTEAMYNMGTNFPQSISDGWHDATIVNDEICGTMSVYVKDNKITRLPMEGTPEGSPVEISTPNRTWTLYGYNEHAKWSKFRSILFSQGNLRQIRDENSRRCLFFTKH